MSLDTTIARITQIEAMLQPSAPPAATAAQPAATSTGGSAFATTLQTAMAPSSLASTAPLTPAAFTPAGATTPVVTPGGATTPVVTPGGANVAANIVSIAESQIGQAEQPPGSNDSPAIATYRSATAGAQAGEPWCAYFASWVAQQAGTPLGAQGQGFGYVGDIWSWAQQTGRAIPNGPGVVPAPGDLILFGDHHVGIVDKVLPNGSIETVEGNYSNQVSQVVRGPGEATGYVRMG